jgi:hypothetical protein
MEQETVEIFGKYVLTREEKEMKSQDLADAIHAREMKEYEKKKAMKQFGSELETISENIRILGAAVRDGYEMRYIQCTVKLDYARKMKAYINVETGEVVKREPLGPEDYQMRMNDVSRSNETDMTEALQ